MHFMRFLLAILASLFAVVVQAETSVSSPPGNSLTASMVQVVFALGCVLGLIVLAAWLMRRLSFPVRTSSGQLRVVSGVMVGQKERVVIVETQGQWLVLGVTPQSVNLLHSMPRPEGVQDAVAAPPPFADWLARAMQKRSESLRGAEKV